MKTIKVESMTYEEIKALLADVFRQVAAERDALRDRLAAAEACAFHAQAAAADLPPLPPPNYPAERDYADAWTEDQVRAYARAALAAAPQPSAEPVGWIACGKRMPAVGEHVIAWAARYGMSGARIDYGHDGTLRFYVDKCEWIPATHWMPLPASPADEEPRND